MKASVHLAPGARNGDKFADHDICHDLSVADAVYHTARIYPGGVHPLAMRMQVSGNTLSHKVNPNNDTHHLTVEEAMVMQEISGTTLILQAMAARLGYTCTPALPAASGDPMALQWQMVAQLADMHHAIADAFAAGVTRNSLRRCDAMAADAISSINNLLGALRAELPAPPKD